MLVSRRLESSFHFFARRRQIGLAASLLALGSRVPASGCCRPTVAVTAPTICSGKTCSTQHSTVKATKHALLLNYDSC